MWTKITLRFIALYCTLQLSVMPLSAMDKEEREKMLASLGKYVSRA